LSFLQEAKIPIATKLNKITFFIFYIFFLEMRIYIYILKKITSWKEKQKK
jgi:hypothetical protein